MDCKEDRDAELRLKDATIQSLSQEVHDLKQKLDENHRRMQEFVASQQLLGERGMALAVIPGQQVLQESRTGRPSERQSEEDLERHENSYRERRREPPPSEDFGICIYINSCHSDFSFVRSLSDPSMWIWITYLSECIIWRNC